MQRARLRSRKVLCLQGADRTTFLQGLVTNDIMGAQAPALIWTALLTPQGRYTADFFVWPEADRLYLDVHTAHAPTILTQLRRYRLRANVQLSETNLIVEAFWDAPSSSEAEALYVRGARRDPRLPEAGWRLICEMRNDTKGEKPEAYDLHRLTLGLPDPVDCVPHKTLALEANLDLLNGVS